MLLYLYQIIYFDNHIFEFYYSKINLNVFMKIKYSLFFYIKFTIFKFIDLLFIQALIQYFV